MTLTTEQHHELCLFRDKHWDNCSNCGRHFYFGENVTIGYSAKGTPLIVCDKCTNQINGEYYKAVYLPKDYERPADDVKLWRYLDFTKFVSLIESSTLFFTRADRFEDPFEGARGYAYQSDKAYEACRKILTLEVRSECTEKSDEVMLEKEVERRFRQAQENFRSNRRHFFISCWHENAVESEAMWKLYTSSTKQGIAIQTTVEKLNNAIDKSFEPQIGRVRYVSYDEPLKPNNVPFWYKRDSFSHEKEIRLILESLDDYDYGIPVPTNVEQMIDNIYVSPLADRWFFDLVKKISSKYGIDKPIHFSQLNESPLY